jgi:glutaredoxin 3
VITYVTQVCPDGVRAEKLLRERGATTIEKIYIDPPQRDVMIKRTERRSVPQIFIEDAHIGGFDELAALERGGKLSALLEM